MLVMLYEGECWPYKVQYTHNISTAKMWMVRWISGNKIMDKIRNNHICKRMQVTHTADKMRGD